MTGGAGLGRGLVGAAILAVWLATVVAGCKSAPQGPPPELLVRPEWKVGDRWTFRRTPMMGPATVAFHEVIEVTPEGYTVRMRRLEQEITRYWTRDFHLSHQTINGRPLNRFDPPAMYFTWPLALGKTWTQEFAYTDGKNDGRYANRWRIADGVERVDVMAGAFGSLRIERLGEGDAPLDIYWWVPQVRYWVKLVDVAGQYTEELVEFRPGAR